MIPLIVAGSIVSYAIIGLFITTLLATVRSESLRKGRDENSRYQTCIASGYGSCGKTCSWEDHHGLTASSVIKLEPVNIAAGVLWPFTFLIWIVAGIGYGVYLAAAWPSKKLFIGFNKGIQWLVREIMNPQDNVPEQEELV